MGNGKWEYFHPNGKLLSESVYIDDIIQGIYKSYFDNGQLQSDITYLNGKKHGVSFDYDINGTVVSRKMYQNDSLVIDEPVIFEQGMISSLDGNEWGLHFVQDGNTAYFTRRDGTTNQKSIYISEKKEGAWTQPVIAPFSTDEDESPFINHQGNILFFASDDRYDGFGGSDIYYSKKINSQWSKPHNLGPIVNSSRNDGAPSFSPDGKYFFFSSNRGDRKDADGEYLWDIYYMESKYLIIE